MLPSGPENIHSSRPKPAHWDALIDIAEKGIATNKEGYAQHREATAVYTYLQEKLSDDELELHRFYGVGHLLCNVAKSLFEPETKSAITEEMGANFFGAWHEEGETAPGLKIDQLNFKVGPTLGTLTYQANTELSPAMQLVNQTLLFTFRERKRGSVFLECLEGGPPIEYPPRTTVDDSFFLSTSVPEYNAQSVIAGPILLTNTALALRRIALIRQGELSPKTYLISDVLKHGGWQPLNLTSISHHAAALRFDELSATPNAASILERCLGTDEQGNVVFDRSRMPKPHEMAAPAGQDPPLHTVRLKCPALYIKGMIDIFTENIVPNAIVHAEKLIAQDLTK